MTNAVQLPDVCVILVAYKGEKWIPPCVETLLAATRSSMRIVLVDNLGPNGLEKLDLTDPRFHVVKTPRPMGFAEANNFGMLHGGLHGRTVCFLNQDTKSPDGWLDECVRVILADEMIGAVCPFTTTYDGESLDWGFEDCARSNAELHGALASRQFAHPFYETERVTAAAMVARREALAAAGPFDLVFGSYYEDYDLCLRIREKGFRIGVAAHATVNHFSGSATSSKEAEIRRSRQILRNKLLYELRRSGPGRQAMLAKYVALTFPRNLARALLRPAAYHPFQSFLGAHADLLRIAPRVIGAARDRREWEAYLRQINWDAAVAAST